MRPSRPHIHTLATQAPAPAGLLPAPRPKKKPRDNEPHFDIRTPLHHLTLGQVKGRQYDMGFSSPRRPCEYHWFLSAGRPTGSPVPVPMGVS